MSEILTGLSGQQYTITDHIKSGGEGGVYNTDFPEYVAKIYDISKINIDARMAELEQKLKYMVSHRIPTKIPNGTVIVTWPQDVLYRNGKFAGYIMPKVSGAKPIYMLNRGGRQANEVIPGYNWKTAVSVAVNLANIVEFLHSRNVVIGDMNSDNLLVYPNGFVVVIDTDSFDITDDVSNIYYKCSVGTEEFLAPELQGRNLERENVRFTKHTDEFALAVHIFQLLMNNMHPFNARVITDYKQSLPENNRNHNIVVGNCPFVRKIDGCEIPLGAPDINALLPDYLVQDFKRTFDYRLDQSDLSYMNKLKEYEESRTPVADWHRHLEQLAKDPGLVQCQSNPEHYYLASKGHCELCEVKKRLPIGGNTGVGSGGDTDVSSGSTGGGTKQKAKKIKLAVIGSIALIMVIIIAYANSIMRDYKTAMNNYNSGNYNYAAYTFENLGDYKDSYEMWQKSMIRHIATHYNNSDLYTFVFVNKLIELGYDDYEDVYHELYDLRVERAFVNTSVDDIETELDYVDRNKEFLVHFLIAGGQKSGGTLLSATPRDFYVKCELPGYYSFYASNDNGNYLGATKGELYNLMFFDFDNLLETIPSTGYSESWIISLYDARTDELLGSTSIVVVTE